MADGSVKIDIVADDSDVKQKVKGTEDVLDDLGDAAEKSSKGMDDLGDSAQKSSKGFGIADVAIGNLVSGGLSTLASKVGEAIQSLVALADETREYREDMAKLDSAFKSAGHSTETAQKAYDGFYKLIGESDRSVEAVNHLAELTTNTEEVAKWTDIAAGVTAKFGDSLPIEGLTEAANETAKVGKVTGPLADALNWAGISEDAFNEKLAACNSEQERATLITSTLSTEYQAAAAEYNELTASTQAAREATNRMEQSQAALGAAIEPVTTAWTNMKATALDWVANVATNVIENTKILTETYDGLTESQRAGILAVHEVAESYRTTMQAAQELAAAQMSDVEYAQEYLIPQLQQLVDSNGQVKQGYEERANFIMGQLNEAFGTEYTRISEIIGANGQLKQSVYDAIEAKKAQILLAPYEENYKTAIQNTSKAEAERKQQLVLVAEQVARTEEAETKLKDVRDEVTKAAETNDRAVMTSLGQRVKDAEAAFDRENKALDKQTEKYKTTVEKIDGYNKDKTAYETAQKLMMEGNIDDAISYLENLNAGYDKTTGKVQESAEEQLKILGDQVVQTEIDAILMKDAYEKGVDGVTAEMVKTAREQAEAAKTEFTKIGNAIPTGIASGAEAEEWSLTTALQGLMSRAVATAKAIIRSKSPSKEFRDEVGKPIPQGVAVGILEDEKLVTKAIETVFDTLKEYSKEETNGILSDIKGFNAELTDEIENHKKELQEIDTKYAEDKKKKDADLVKLEKEYNESIEKENKRHEEAVKKSQDSIKKTITDRMKDLVSLGDEYKENVKKLWEDLDKSISDLQQNYDDQLASRTESIADSLNLWSAATKNKTNAKDLKKNLQSQVKMLDDFNAAIANLEGRNVSEEFVNRLKEMGVGSTGEIEALVSMTDAELSNYVSLWEKKNQLAHEAALEELEPLKAETKEKIHELTNAAILEYENMRSEFKEEGALLAEELKQAMIESGDEGYNTIISQMGSYTEAGMGLMDSITQGVLDKSPFLEEAVEFAVQKALDRAAEVAGYESTNDWSPTLTNMKKAMSSESIAAKIQATVNSENARMTSGVGVRDMGFSEVAQAVGMQTAGINSLASEYRKGSSQSVTVPLVLDGRELGRAIVDLGSTETNRTGLVFA